MTLLILGLLLWSGAHLFKRIAPEKRAALGQKGQGIVALAILAGVALMILGYRMADFIPVWSPPAFLTHLNNLLMVIAVFLFAMSSSRGVLRGKMRHPQLTGVKTWALAHLLVNGDLASIILFGGLMAWAVVSVILINKAGPWDRPEPGPRSKDIPTVIGTLAVFAIITLIHGWIGPSPFPG